MVRRIPDGAHQPSHSGSVATLSRPDIDQSHRPAIAFPLRPYQRESIAAVRAAWQQRGIRRQLIVLPTGGGKTVVFSHLIRCRRGSGRALVIAHREELLEQAADKLRQVAPDLRVGIVKAERDEHDGADVVVASIQTIARPERLAPLIRTVATVIIDEAHHAVARTYVEVLEALGCFDADGPLTVGVTATAGERGDGVGLSEVWQEIVYERGILQMIADGYLVDVRALHVETDLDFRRVATRNGDFTSGSLGAEMDDSGAIEAAAETYAKFAPDRRGVAFTPTIATAEEMAALLNRHGIRAESLSGQTPADERKAILKRLHTGDTQVVTNCAVLTEGFDEPALSCALIARPTRSRPLFVQMVGRVLRPYPGKDGALVLVMNAPPEAGLATISDLAGSSDPKTSVTVQPGESLAEAGARTAAFGNRRTYSRLSASEVNLFARSGLRWLPADRGFALPCPSATLLLLPDGDDRWQVVEARRGSDPRSVAASLSLELAQGLGEEYARSRGGVIARADARWRDRPVTPAQQGVLAKMRLPAVATSGEASDAIAAASAIRLVAQLTRGRCA